MAFDALLVAIDEANVSNHGACFNGIDERVVTVGLVLGKPIGILSASCLAIKMRIATAPPDTTRPAFVGAACLCGVGVTVALLMADQAFLSANFPGVAKIGVLVGSTLAAAIGAGMIVSGTRRERSEDARDSKVGNHTSRLGVSAPSR